MKWRRWGAPERPQLDVALAALGDIEDACGALPDPPRRAFRATDWEAVADDDGPGNGRITRLPRDERSPSGPATSTRSVVTRSTATLVRLAKFSTEDQVRGRAFYLDQVPALTVKFVIGPRRTHAPLAREITARRSLAAARQLPAPAVVDAGATTKFSYLAETVVFGRHAYAPELKQRLALEIVTALLRTHAAVGVTDEPVTMHPRTLDRLEGLFESDFMCSRPGLERLAAYARRLVADRTVVPVGWCHGDLGFSNVIVDDYGGPTLVDWEHAGRHPIAADLAKLAVMSPTPRAVAAHIVNAAGPGDIGAKQGRRVVADQLATLLVRELSWWEGRRERAASAGRLAPFERGIRRRLDLLDLLVEMG